MLTRSPTMDGLAHAQSKRHLSERSRAKRQRLLSPGGAAEATGFTRFAFYLAFNKDKGSGSAVPKIAKPNKRKLFILERLPKDTQTEIVSLLDVITVCRLCHVATDQDLVKVIGKRLKTLTVEVTLNAILADDPAMIGFDTAALLPRWCHVHVKASVGLWELTKGYLLQL
ncbi:hypothetical protein JNB11_05490 [Kocuria palustris]|nr:hypothetical protein [Kocuria palustris]